MKKDLTYYIGLNYTIEVIQIPEDEGGGVILTIPVLGRASMNAYGENFEEALDMLNELKKDSFTRWLDEGLPIPEPEEETEVTYSGRYALRMPKLLHRMLAEKAEKENVSINSLINTLLSSALSESIATEKSKETMKVVLKECFQDIEWPDRHVFHHIGSGDMTKSDSDRRIQSEWDTTEELEYA